MNITEKLELVRDCKSDIKNAIEAKGVTVGDASFDQYASKIGEINGGVEEAPENDVNFYDYDGFRVASYTIAEAKALTALPTPPSHEGLTFQEWNWTLNEIQNYNRQYIDVGANYEPTDGKTHLVVQLISTSITLTIYSSVGDVVVDWGDNTTDSHTYTSETRFTFTHNYSQLSQKNISISYNGSGWYAFYTVTSSANFGGFILKELWCNSKFRLDTNNYGLRTLWDVFSISTPKELIAIPTIYNCRVRRLTIPRNNGLALNVYTNFQSCDIEISFPKEISGVTQDYTLYVLYTSRIVLPSLTGTIPAHTFDNTKASIISIPNAQFATLANGRFFNANYVLEYIDIVQGWTPSQSMTISESGRWTAENLVKFFTRLGTTQTAITLTFGSTNLNKLTADQKAIATNKGYTLA